MDINEVSKGAKYRHPWELSRTGCVLHELKPYIRSLGDNCDYINIGAGDMFFDRYLLREFRTHRLHAVDLGYEYMDAEKLGIRTERVHLYTDISEIEPVQVDYAFMMDVLEYMEDDEAYVRTLSERVRSGGYIFFTLPAYQFLFSKHDVIVKNLRRYDRNSFNELIKRVGDIEIVSEHYFYTSLFIIRAFQKLTNADIDPDEKVTTGWRYSEKNTITRVVRGFLDFDYDCNQFLASHGLGLPGLSLLVVCRRL